MKKKKEGKKEKKNDTRPHYGLVSELIIPITQFTALGLDSKLYYFYSEDYTQCNLTNRYTGRKSFEFGYFSSGSTHEGRKGSGGEEGGGGGGGGG